MSDMDFLEKQAFERASFKLNGKANSQRGEKIRTRVTSLPVDLPEGYSYPNFKTVFSEEKKKVNNEIKKTEANSKNSGINELLKDPEAALLTGLIMLLRQEGADEALIAALSYILL